MKAEINLTLTSDHHKILFDSTYLGDGKEAVAIMLCGRRSGKSVHRLLCHRVIPLPMDVYKKRSPVIVSWSTSFLRPILREAARKGMAIIKVHSHPTGHQAFSSQDDHSDNMLFPSIHGWIDDDLPHASVIILPNGEMFGRAFHADGTSMPLSKITVVGDDIRIWPAKVLPSEEIPLSAIRNIQAFGKETYRLFRMLRVGIVGCSGTGCPTILQLAMNEIGHEVLVDDDRIGEENLTRIPLASSQDIDRLKVEVMADWIRKNRPATSVEIYATDLSDPQAIRAIGECDIVFGCMDSIDGRYLLNRIATFYLLPYFDLGVRLDADGKGGVDQVCGTVNFIQPGKSSLLTRGAFTRDQLSAAMLKREAPEIYAERVAENYIRGVEEDRPAVGPLNGFFVNFAIMDFLARLHPYRLNPNSDSASWCYSFSGDFIRRRGEAEMEPDTASMPYVGRGDISPLLNMPHLSLKENAA